MSPFIKCPQMAIRIYTVLFDCLRFICVIDALCIYNLFGKERFIVSEGGDAYHCNKYVVTFNASIQLSRSLIVPGLIAAL